MGNRKSELWPTSFHDWPEEHDAGPVPPGLEENLPGKEHVHARPPLEPSAQEADALSLAAHSRVKARVDAKESQFHLFKVLKEANEAQDAAAKAELSAQKSMETLESVRKARNESIRVYLGLPPPSQASTEMPGAAQQGPGYGTRRYSLA
eukprot:gb/GFBE01029456.1/.p1 GENE.gb/GFBE01029456.1/~~gb/GFBE01029456.1/.p1  ORF type:complete len:150 (+),score=32.45 gb/GFBE01029456.1/:1-450(+)